MKIRYTILIATCWLAGLSGIRAQPESPLEAEAHSLRESHRISFGLGHTHVSEGKIANKTEWLTLASFSLNYDYWLTDRWAIGLQSDLVLEEFFIESDNGEEIERSHPVTLVPVSLLKAGNHLACIGGIGVEITRSEKLALTRLGLEYSIPFPHHWEVSVETVWDAKWAYYNSWLLGITISKIMSGKKPAAGHLD